MHQKRVDVDDVDEFVIDEFLEAKADQFTSVAGATNAAERKVRLDFGRMIDEHHACGDFPRDLRTVRDVRGEDRSAEAERRVIGDADRILLVSGSKQHRDGPEELPVPNRIVLADLGQDRGLDEGASVGHGGADLLGLRAMSDSMADQFLQIIGRLLRGQRGECRFRVERIAGSQPGNTLAVAIQKGVIDRIDEDHAL